MRIWVRKLRRHVDEPDEVFRARLKTYLLYERATGHWYYRHTTRWNKQGDRADRETRDGYFTVCVGGKKYRSHVLAYFYVTGKWAPKLVDHRNRRRGDNRWVNIRPANRSQNAGNSKLRSDNKSGLKGVHWNKERGCWTAQISWEGKTKMLAYSACPAAAHFAYLIAADVKYGEFARAR